MQQRDCDGLEPSNGARPTTWCWKAIRKPAGNTQKPNASTPKTPRSRKNIPERQAAGIAAAKERGVYPGRQGGTTKAKPPRAAELRAKGLTDSEVAEAMGVSRRTVQRYLRLAD